MKRYIITGVTGHVGNNIVRELLKHDVSIKVLVRKLNDPSIKDLAVEFAVGDITDISFLEKVIEPDSILIHSAGIIDITNRQKDLMKTTNIIATQNIVDIAIKNKVKQFIYISSVDAINRPKIGRICEPERFSCLNRQGYYAYTKMEASNYVLDKIQNLELNGCILCPSAVIGPNDFKISNVGQAIIDCIDHRMMARFKGGYNFIDARDIGKLIVMIPQQTDSIYLLTGENVTIDQLFRIIYRHLNRKKLPIYLPFWLVRFGSNFTGLYYRKRKVRPVFTKKALLTLAENHDYDNQKAIDELGLTITPVEKSIIDSIDWLNIYYKKKTD